jgi:hypothetical protein
MAGPNGNGTTTYEIISEIFSLPQQREWFCVGPNPLLKALRLHAEVNLYKIRSCRNITGMRRSLDFYSGATDQVTGLPTIGASGQLSIPAATVARPTPYRYSALIERAKDLTRTAQQLEALMLATLERQDAEAYSLLQARQNAQLARETVRLNELQVLQANDRVIRTQLQEERAQIEQDHFAELLATGPTEQEEEAPSLLADAAEHERNSATLAMAAGIAYGVTAAAYMTAAAIATADRATLLASAASNATQSVSAFGGMEAATAQVRSLQAQMAAQRAGFERMREDWQLRQRLATQDVMIAAQDSRVEEDGVRIAEQQRTVSEIQSDNAEQLVDFLHNKFTSVALYEWMGDLLEGAYSSVLQHATATARLAAAQLAFERQGSRRRRSPSTIGSRPHRTAPAATAPARSTATGSPALSACSRTSSSSTSSRSRPTNASSSCRKPSRSRSLSRSSSSGCARPEWRASLHGATSSTRTSPGTTSG